MRYLDSSTPRCRRFGLVYPPIFLSFLLKLSLLAVLLMCPPK